MAVKYKVIDGCVFCGACVSGCPVHAIRYTPTKAQIDPEKCIGCGICYRNCCVEAIVQDDSAGSAGERNKG